MLLWRAYLIEDALVPKICSGVKMAHLLEDGIPIGYVPMTIILFLTPGLQLNNKPGHRYGRPLVVARIWALVGSLISASGLHGNGGQILPRRARRARAVRNCESCVGIERRGPRAIFFTASVRWSGSGPANTMPRAAKWLLFSSLQPMRNCAVLSTWRLKTFATC
jgi:hypothetical protein